MTKDSDFEPVDNTPVEIPTRLRLPSNRVEQLRAYIRAEVSRASQEQGAETFEEADDFELDDEAPEPYTPYEMHDLEPDVTPPSASPPPSAPPAKPPSERSEEPGADRPAGSSSEQT